MNSTQHLVEYGYALLKSAVGVDLLGKIHDQIIDVIEEETGQRFENPLSEEVAQLFADRTDLESKLFERFSREPWLREFLLEAALADHLSALLGRPHLLSQRPPFIRLDGPGKIRQMAHWHQDFFFIGGDPRQIVVWIPLQRMSFGAGCLSVMPGSHVLGPLPHDLTIGQRQVPSGHFNREIRLIEADWGDALFFDVLLLHSTNVNYTSSMAYTITARFEPCPPNIPIHSV